MTLFRFRIQIDIKRRIKDNEPLIYEPGQLLVRLKMVKHFNMIFLTHRRLSTLNILSTRVEQTTFLTKTGFHFTDWQQHVLFWTYLHVSRGFFVSPLNKWYQFQSIPNYPNKCPKNFSRTQMEQTKSFSNISQKKNNRKKNWKIH